MKRKNVLLATIMTVLSLTTLLGCGETTKTWTVTCPWAPSGVAAMVNDKTAELSTKHSKNIILESTAVKGDAATVNTWVSSTAAEDPELVFAGEGLFAITNVLDPSKLEFTYDDFTFVENLYSSIFVMSADASLGINSIDSLKAYMEAGNNVTVATNGATSSEAFLAAALFGDMGFGSQMEIVPYASAAEAADAVSRGEANFAVSHQSQILDTYNAGGVSMVCAFDKDDIAKGPFAGVEGVGKHGYPYFRNRCFIMARNGASDKDVTALKTLYGTILADTEVSDWLANEMLLEVDTMTEADVQSHIDNVTNIVNEYKDVLAK